MLNDGRLGGTVFAFHARWDLARHVFWLGRRSFFPLIGVTLFLVGLAIRVLARWRLELILPLAAMGIVVGYVWAVGKAWRWRVIIDHDKLRVPRWGGPVGSSSCQVIWM